jgi:hypothetical protein
MKKILFSFSTFGIFLLLVTAAFASFGVAHPYAYSVPISVIGSLFTMPQGAMGVVFTEGLCANVQKSLIEIYKSKTPSQLRTPVGYLEALNSSQNRSNTEVIPVDPGNGKKKQVTIKMMNRGCEDDIITSEPKSCSTSIEKEPFEDTVAVTHYIGTKGIKFNEDEMTKLCEADDAWRASVIQSEINPMMTKLNKSLLALQGSNFGAFVPALTPPATYKTANLLIGPEKRPSYIAESEIIEDFQNLEASGRPILVGAGNLSHYVRQVGIGCCNDYGIDLNQAGNFDFFRDKHVESILGANHFIGLVPGYVQLLTWNKYVGPYAKQNDTFTHGTIVDPYTGLKLDMKVHYDDCADLWYVQFGLWYELYFLPSKAWAYCDDLAGVNFTQHYLAAAIADPCCEPAVGEEA